jgi:hypothetical protein
MDYRAYAIKSLQTRISWPLKVEIAEYIIFNDRDLCLPRQFNQGLSQLDTHQAPSRIVEIRYKIDQFWSLTLKNALKPLQNCVIIADG